MPRNSGPLPALFSLLPVLAGLMLAGCVTRYVVVSEVSKSDLELVVFTSDAGKGEQLLEALAERGFDNDHNHVAVPTEDEPSISWGGATQAQIEEIIAFIEGRYSVELDREHEFKLDDYNVFITLPAGEGPAVEEEVEREDLRVVVFTDDEEKGNRLLAALQSLGYTNTENYVTDEPNEDFNVKWGAAPEAMIDEVVELAEGEFDVELDRQQSFDDDDRDVFINLPFGQVSEGWDKSDVEITVFSDSAELGGQVLELLSGLGYDNEDNEALTGPNDDFNIKYGGLPEPMLEEITKALATEFKTEFRRSEEFGKTSRQVFINLPAAK
jgi:hypothetical protein